MSAARQGLRGVLTIGGGALAGQLILIAATPILSRLYAPDAFGAFSALVAVASVIGPSAALKFDAGIVLPEKDAVAGTVARLAFGSAVITSLVSAGVVAVLEVAGYGSAWEGVSLAPLWVGVLVFLTATFTTLTQAALRERRYSLVARRAPIQSIGTAVGQIAFGFVAPTPAGLLGGFTLGRLAGFLPLLRHSWTLISRPGPSWSTTVREYWRLPALLAPSALLNSLGSQIPLLAVAAIFGSHAAGEFGMAQRLVYIPVTLVGAAVAQVFAAELAKHVREGGVGAVRVYRRTSLQLAALALPVAVLIAVAGPWAVPFILGDAWVLAGELCVPLALLVGLSLVVMPTSQVYTIFQSPASLAVDASRIVLLGIALAIIVGADLPLIESAWLLTIAQGVNYVATWVYGMHVTRKAAG